MARIIEQLAYKITGDTGQFDKSIDGTDKKTTGLTGKLGSLGKMLTVGAVAVGIVAVGKKLFNMATDAAAAGDRVDKMSQKIGISRDAFQEWDFILSQSGASVDGLQMSVKTLSNAASEARDGTAEYKDEFDRLGISVTDTNGKMKTQEGLLNEVFAALSNMEDETQRTATASKLLGRSATELAPAMNQGADSIEAMRQKSHELGLVLKDELIDEAVKFTDNMDQLRRKGKALLTEAIAPLLTPMNSFMGYLIDGNDPTRKLAEAIDILKSASAEYQIVTKKLNGDLKGITASEKTRLELRQVESLLEIRNAVKDLSGSYGELKQEEEDLTNERVLLTAKSTLATNVLSGYTEEQKASALAHGKQVIAIRDNMWFMELQGQATRGSTDAFIKENEATIRIMDAYNLFNDSQDKLITNDERIFEIKSKTNPVIQTAAELVKAEMLNIDNLLVSDIELYNAIMNLVDAKEEIAETTTEEVALVKTNIENYKGLARRYYDVDQAVETLNQTAEANIDNMFDMARRYYDVDQSMNGFGTAVEEVNEDLVENNELAEINIRNMNRLSARYYAVATATEVVADSTDELKSKWVEALGAVGNTISWIGRLQDAQADAQIANLDEEILGEEKYASEKRRIMRESAEAQKKTSIFEAIVGTASAIVQASPNLLLMALAGVSGALQLATINATPLPSYDVGSINIPETQTATVHKGEMILPASIANEARQSGVSISPSGGGGNVYLDGVEVGKILWGHGNGGRLGVLDKRIVQ